MCTRTYAHGELVGGTGTGGGVRLGIREVVKTRGVAVYVCVSSHVIRTRVFVCASASPKLVSKLYLLSFFFSSLSLQPSSPFDPVRARKGYGSRGRIMIERNVANARVGNTDGL